MEDAEFEALKVRAAVCPSSDSWPTPSLEGMSIKGDRPTLPVDFYWSVLLDTVADARERVLRAYGAMAGVDADKNLSREGKAAEKAKIAKDAIASFASRRALPGHARPSSG